MNRIPTEGLKPEYSLITLNSECGLNEQNPDRGIETTVPTVTSTQVAPLE